MSIIGKEISETRKSKGITQEELAELSKVNLRTIQRIENNESEPRGKTLKLICEVLDIDVEDLINSNKQIEGDFNNNLVHGYKLASKGKRFLGSLLETIIYSITIYLPYTFYKTSSLNGFVNGEHPIGFGFAAIFGLIIGAIFYPMFSGNLGHRIIGLKVISSETGDDYQKATEGAIRELLKGVFSFFLIPIIWVLWDDKNQNLYDKLSKTYVVEKII
ncbi:helix-turn-helix domain-containing protein [Cyclobacterium marinum]|uniref:Helix-turn-helix domain protein n=1 Tax=Cyclobacterium marinum (strain ATCC 25205 / DSM 745 / LMG 13164 / NCIMB 1802) TaxID=880070 RepID=G0IZP9_CYCMS|nr:helix-turn-helix domain-containing protein [Cyclobacterium marinum]AEL25713.1 helix-turn-helix domain protein [Cyclobacterium marinum DSM 745]